MLVISCLNFVSDVALTRNSSSESPNSARGRTTGGLAKAEVAVLGLNEEISPRNGFLKDPLQPLLPPLEDALLAAKAVE